jgi:hypothetical protein
MAENFLDFVLNDTSAKKIAQYPHWQTEFDDIGQLGFGLGDFFEQMGMCPFGKESPDLPVDKFVGRVKLIDHCFHGGGNRPHFNKQPNRGPLDHFIGHMEYLQVRLGWRDFQKIVQIEMKSKNLLYGGVYICHLFDSRHFILHLCRLYVFIKSFAKIQDIRPVAVILGFEEPDRRQIIIHYQAGQNLNPGFPERVLGPPDKISGDITFPEFRQNRQTVDPALATVGGGDHQTDKPAIKIGADIVLRLSLDLGGEILIAVTSSRLNRQAGLLPDLDYPLIIRFCQILINHICHFRGFPFKSFLILFEVFSSRSPFNVSI